MKKRILFVINSLGCGGAEKSLISLLGLMDYEKYDVTLYMFRHDGMFLPLLPKEVHIHEKSAYTEFCSKSGAGQLMSFDFKKLRARIRTSLYLRKNAKSENPLHDAQVYWKYSGEAFDVILEKYDAAIAWGQGTPTHFVAEKVNADKKYAWVNVNYKSAGHNPNFDNRFYSEYDKIICVSDKLNQLFCEVFPAFADRIITILDINNPEMITRMADESCSYPGAHGKTIVTVGRIVPQKAYDIAIDTARILKSRGFDFHWYAIGDGSLRGELEKRIADCSVSDCFTFLGARANPYPYMKNADIYVQTSRFEGYCLTLAEARMLNVPCVATEFDVVHAQMLDGENGLIVGMNAESVADGIMRLAEDRELYAHIKDYLKHEKKGNTEEIEKIYALLEG